MEASSSEWATGMKGGGRGVHYQLKLKINKNNISFDSVWINQSGYVVEMVKGKERNYQQPLLKNDTVIIRFTELLPGKDQKESSESKKIVASPRKYHGKALFRYYSGKKKKYYVVKKFEKEASPLIR